MALSNHALTTVAAVTEIIGEDAAGRTAVIEAFINQASRLIMNYCGREISPQVNAEVRSFEYDGSGLLDLGRSDLRSVTSISITRYTDDSWPTSTSSAVTNYQLMPMHRPEGAAKVLRLPKMDAGFYVVDITGNWGWTSVPDDIERACIRTVSHWFNTEILMQTPSAPDMPMPSLNLPFDVRMILNRYRRVRVG